MARIPDEELERLKRETDLAALVRAHGVELRQHRAIDRVVDGVGEGFNDPTPAGYNAFAGAMGTNIERALIDVYRENETELTLVDFKLSSGELFDLWAGPVGFLAGIEYRPAEKSQPLFVADIGQRLPVEAELVCPVTPEQLAEKAALTGGNFPVDMLQRIAITVVAMTDKVVSAAS